MSKYHTVEDNPIEWESDRNYGVTKNSFIFSFKDCDDIKKPIFSRVINEKSAILNKRTQESRSINWWRRPYFESKKKVKMENYNQMDVPTSTAFDIFFNETSTRFLPVICLENIGELRNIAFKAPNAIVVFGIILVFLILFILVIIPSNVIYVKIAININLLLIMRFFSILEDKPSNKKRGWGCVVLFAFDDTEEKDLSESPHEFILERYIPGNNLHNEIKKTNKVYKLFDGIGLEKIDYIESFSADDIKFRTHFWEKPEDAFDRIRDMNISNPEEVRAEVLESPSRLSPAPPLPCNEDGDAGNPAGEGNNTTTSSVQPPFYDDNQQSLNSMDGGSLWNLVDRESV
ncbi:hypothetical protein GLOIN_2v1772519 [Rhizophagus irregularis DAOM 181602=DAOM 197198]|uniref:Uncharacterized protein n=1 Tax=Rhizophagus irregularis (strain DAOM 181602 / DAOM 197198 / MUCL 43194) TaxID=747089 RepID=A0A2P4Q715_RHIID|nr:hypothetical protein GLOIN_2v1772519 [Rhizophagus irregularis DAOM 181602=DAOM 197198]POG73445.1 hypothetical protein GLOIN_2v1772519 [Rhizophagus irregularis DAOM 181602=DAOM 197198]|eukprot:XP_025180311.1 hypothetical protein GLOIN_2v1772519 [Rhizophagus irregularis DAOM 181602=DAOM 197198]